MGCNTRLRMLCAGLALIPAACSPVSPDELAARYNEHPSNLPHGFPAPSTDHDLEPLAVDSHECHFSTDDIVGDVVCGSIVFPAPAGSDARPVRLSFARFIARDRSAEPDPVVYLHGGPGSPVLAQADWIHGVVVEPFVERRDVIVYDQRGAGESSPLPLCDNVYHLEEEFFSSPSPHTGLVDEYVDALHECGDQLADNDRFDLDSYHSARHATDVAVLMASLGYDQYNLHGSSYGSRLAQTVMRDHPDAVRSVIMSGVYPLEENLVGAVPATFRNALDTLFSACVDDSVCGVHLPDPWTAFDDIVAALDADPLNLDVPVSQHEAYEVQIAGDDLINAVHAMLYTVDDAAMIPDAFADYLAGHTGKIERIAQNALFDIGDVAPYLTVQCRDEAPFTSAEQAALAAASTTPYDRVGLTPGLVGADLLDACAGWAAIGVAGPIENEPVTWDAPTLLLSGGIDPITPPWWAEQIADRLPNAVLAHFADRGHDSNEGRCAAQIMADFVDTPGLTVDIDCASEWSRPYLDNTPAAVVDPLTADFRSIEIWSSSDDHSSPLTLDVPAWPNDDHHPVDVFWRNLDWPDFTAVLVHGGALDPALLYPFFDTEVSGPIIDANESNLMGPGWQRWIKTTAGLDMVVYERTGDTPLTLALLAYDNELATLETNVLLPMAQSVIADGAP